MSRHLSFKFGRRSMVWVAGLAMATQFMVQQPAHADVSWVTDILQPMMNQVVGPALQKGLESWQAKHTKGGSPQVMTVPPVGQTVPSATTTTTSVPSTAVTVPTASPEEPANSSIQWDAAFN